MSDRWRIRLRGASEARAVADSLGALYAEAYAGTPQADDPFYSAARFAERLNGYTSSPGFRLVTAETAEGDLAGYAFGYSLPPGARWWNGLLDATPDGFTTETGSRTFALNELHVQAGARGQGVASTMHESLLQAGQQDRATVLVRPDNPARNIYEHWGYRSIGRLKPFEDSPAYVALVLDPARPRGER